jgi:hypothetical protein
VAGCGGVKNPRCEAATICGGRPGLFSLANDADRGEPTNECDRLTFGRFPGKVSPPAVLKVNPCALDWRPRPGLRARTVSRGASGVLEWTSKSVSSGSEAPGTESWKEEG